MGESCSARLVALLVLIRRPALFLDTGTIARIPGVLDRSRAISGTDRGAKPLERVATVAASLLEATAGGVRGEVYLDQKRVENSPGSLDISPAPVGIGIHSRVPSGTFWTGIA